MLILLVFLVSFVNSQTYGSSCVSCPASCACVTGVAMSMSSCQNGWTTCVPARRLLGLPPGEDSSALCCCDSPSVTCSRCLTGYTGVSSNCVTLVACPALTTGWPQCRCQNGTVGTVSWDNVAETWSANCSISCPTNAANSSGGVCVCNTGYSGNLRWNSTISSWQGTCLPTPCPANASGAPACACNVGFRGSALWNSTAAAWDFTCRPVSCPANSSGLPCQCNRGLQGITWNTVNQTWNGSCQVVSCPANTTGSPSCVCNPGFVGSTQWNASAGTWSANCQVLGCPANSSGEVVCNCNSGFVGTVVWNNVSSTWNSSCRLAPCVNNSLGMPCQCRSGYRGNITWNSANAAWDGTCQLVSCPGNATGAPSCVCNSGFRGTPVWNLSLATWTGACNAMRCPTNSTGHPNCTCDVGYEGIVSWSSQTWVSNCSVASCPANVSAGAPACRCLNGYTGQVNWNTALRKWTGNCSNINECTNITSCQQGGICIDFPGNFHCAPILIKDSLVVQDCVATSIGLPCVLNNTRGGQLLTMQAQVYDIFFNVGRYCKVVLAQTSGRKTKRECLSLNVLISPSVLNLSCLVPPGVGANYIVQLVCTTSVDTITQTLLSNSPSIPSLSYPPPQLIPGTLRLDLSIDFTTNLRMPNLEPSIITFKGQNFVANDADLKVYYFLFDGKGEIISFPCLLQPQTNETDIYCQTTNMNMAYQGFTFNIFVDAGGQLVNSTDVITYPTDMPVIISGWGCERDLTDCPATGGTMITIIGINLGQTDTFVNIGSKPCPVSFITPTQVICELPMGVGTNDIILNVDNWLVAGSQSFSKLSLSYVKPTISSISGCQDVGAMSTKYCPRDVETTITITGKNFGSRVPLIFIGTELCSDVNMEETQDWLTCVIPPNGPNDLLSILLMQDGGLLSEDDISLSYAACPTGTVLINQQCEPCIGGTYSSTYLCENCSPGRYAPEGKTGDCLFCPAGKYQLLEGQIACELCPAGTFNPLEGHAQECPGCPSGYYTNQTGLSDCIPCEIGRFQSNTSSIECKECVSGKYAKIRGSDQCEQCADGKWSEAGDSCYECGRGNVSTNSGCVACMPGFFASENFCKACPTGSFNNVSSSVSCEACEEGSYQAQNNGTQCYACQPGQYSDSAKTSCLACNAGFYSNQTTISNVCLECDVGTYQNQSGQTECLPCAPGFFADQTTATVCQRCAINRYSAIGASRCLACPAGKEWVDITSCRDCPDNQYRPENETVCLDCPVGRERVPGDGSSCRVCVRGRVRGAGDGDRCVACLPGYYSPREEGTYCSPCELGSYSTDEESFSCSLCAVGKTSLRNGTDCEVCPSGKYSDENRQCVSCPMGKYSLDGEICKDCSPGFYQSNTSMAMCTRCGDGTIAPDPAQSACAPCSGTNRYTADGVTCASCPSQKIVKASLDGCICRTGYFTVENEGSGGGSGGGGGNDVSCISCPTGGNCNLEGLTLDKVQARPGYWRDNQTFEFIRCIEASHCLGGSSCSEGRTGPLCAQCDSGYQGSTYEKCQKCPSKDVSLGLVILFILLILAALILLYWSVLYDNRWQQLQQELYPQPQQPQHAHAHAQEQDQDQPGQAPQDDFDAVSQNVRSSVHGSEVGLPSSPSRIKGHSIVRSKKILDIPTENYLLDHDLETQGYDIVSEQSYARSSNIYNLKILLAFAQVSTALRYLPSMAWPPTFRAFIAAFDWVNFSFIPWSNIGCVVEYDYFEKTAIMIIFPLVLIGGSSFIIFSILAILNRFDYFSDSSLARERRREKFRQLYTKAIIFTLFLIYPSLSRQVLSIFRCEKVGGVWYLVVDFSLQCQTPRWSKYATIAGIGVIIYPFGIPALFLTLLYLKRRTLRHVHTMISFGFLYEAFSRSMWWFEFLDMLYKLLMTSVIVFLPDEGQLIAALLLVVGYICFIAVSRPYVLIRNETFAILTQVALFILLLTAYVTKHRGEVSGPNEVLLSVLMILVALLSVGVFLLFIILSTKHIIKKKVRESRMLKNIINLESPPGSQRQSFSISPEDNNVIEMSVQPAS